MRRLAPLGMLLALAACGEPAENSGQDIDPAPATPALAPQVPTTGPVLPKPLAWTATGVDDIHVLTLQEGSAEVLRIACVPDTGMVVHGGRLSPVGSEERMSVGAGATVVTLVATPAADRDPPIVKGEGAIDLDFLRALGEGRKIAINYGYQNMGPYDGPSAEVVTGFVAGCQAIAASEP